MPEYTAAVKQVGVEIVGSIEGLLGRVGMGVSLETNDGRPHLEQAGSVLRAGKPVFVDRSSSPGRSRTRWRSAGLRKKR